MHVFDVSFLTWRNVRGRGVLSALPPVGMYDHPALGPVLYSVSLVSDDPDKQVGQVIGMMSGYAASDAKSPLFQQDIIMCAALGGGDPISDVWAYLNRQSGYRGMRFVSDEITGAPWDETLRWRPLVEALIRPVDQAWLSNPQGDCDDFAMYGASHLIARGVPCSFVTVAADDSDPNMYSHVYLVAFPQSGPFAGQRVPMDLSHGPYVGWETANRFGKRREWPVGSSGFGLLGFGLLAAGGYFLYRMAVN
jgi:hypothetical protein